MKRNAISGNQRTAMYDGVHAPAHRQPRTHVLFRHTCNDSAGFSLTELMVVMAIIALLAGTLVFAVSRVRERAIMARCQNNLREHGQRLVELPIEIRAYEFGIEAHRTERYGEVSTVPAGGGRFWVQFSDSDRPMEVDIERLEREGFDGPAEHPYSPLASGGTRFKDYMDGFTIPDEVRHCPAIPNPEALIDPDSPFFKGSRESGVDEVLEDFWGWDGYRHETGEQHEREYLDVTIRTTTYALNTRVRRPEIIAYVDWNAEEGWGYIEEEGMTGHPVFGEHGDLYHTRWQFNNEAKGIVQDTPKGDYWWNTEVGFHHMGGANYITWGGRGGWVHKNNIKPEQFGTARYDLFERRAPRATHW